MMTKIWAIGVIAMLVLGVDVVSSKVNSTSIDGTISIDKVVIQDSAMLTEEAMINEVLQDEQITAEELKKLYDRGVKIIAVETTEDPEVINHAKTQMKDYSLIIPGCLAAELDRLIAMDYKKTHGYLPEETGITPDNITEEELKKLIEERKVEMGDAPAVQTKSLKSSGDPDDPPYQYNGNIFVKLYPAKDEDHASAGGANWNDVAAAISPFEEEFDVNMIQSAYYNGWDTSDVGDSVYDLLPIWLRIFLIRQLIVSLWAGWITLITMA